MSEEVTNTENTEVVENKTTETSTKTEETKQPSVDELLGRIATMEQDLKAAREEAKKHRKDKTATKSELETIDTVRSQLEGELESEKGKYGQLLDRLKMTEVNNSVKAALDEAKCLSHRTMTREVMDRIDSTYDPETGKTTIVVKDAEGKPMFVKGKEATLADLVKELRADPELAHAFEGVQQGGTGATAPSDLTTKESVENPWKTGNVTMQHKLANEKPELAARLKKEAGKAPPATSLYHRY